MSLKLPGYLSAWEPQLRIFPEEVALGLGPAVQKIASLVGPFFLQHAEGRVVPDGFAGLAKRGTYDRLIASDWLLADELPDEFMRRSVMGEHLFWKLAYREPAQVRSTVVLFDSGPEQLGSPRVLHIAALAVFAARARVAKANFGWGILQRPSRGCLPGMNASEVEELLEARGSRSATAEHFAAWTQLRTDQAQDGEVWIVGSERLRSLLPVGFSALLVTDLILPGEQKLGVECRPAGKDSRTLELNLPPLRACVRLLRDPFSVQEGSQRQLTASLLPQRMVFNATGYKLYVRTLDNSRITALPVPNSPRESMGKSKQYETVSRFPQIAVARIGRTTVLVSLKSNAALRVQMTGKQRIGLEQGNYEFADLESRPIFQPDSFSLAIWNQAPSPMPGLYLLDDYGSLVRLYIHPSRGRIAEVIHRNVLALDHSGKGLRFAAYEPEDGGRIRIFGEGLDKHVERWDSPTAPCKAYFGYNRPGTTRPFGVFALSYNETHWEIHSGRRTEVIVPEGCSVHGVLGQASYEEALIVVESDRRTLSLHGPHGARRLAKSGSPIVSVAASHQAPLIAYGNEAEEIAIYSLQHDGTVLDFRQGGLISRKPQGGEDLTREQSS